MIQRINDLVEEYKLAFLHANGKERLDNIEIYTDDVYLWVGSLPFSIDDISRLSKKLLSKVKKD